MLKLYLSFLFNIAAPQNQSKKYPFTQKQLLQKFEENDKRLQENLNSANAIMSNIGVAIQQSVGILGQLLAPRNQIPPNAIQQMYMSMNFQAPPQ